MRMGGNIGEAVIVGLRKSAEGVQNAKQRRAILNLVDDAKRLKKIQDAAQAKLFKTTRAGKSLSGGVQGAAVSSGDAVEGIDHYLEQDE
jgi:hypothetical protein